MDIDKVVRRKQLLEMIGVSAATQYRMERAGLFPARFKLGKGLVGWHLTEVEEWLKNREPVSVQCPDTTFKGIGVVPQLEVPEHRSGGGER